MSFMRLLGKPEEKMNRAADKIKQIVDGIPDFQSIRGVYAVIVFMLYSWTLLTSFYNLPERCNDLGYT